MDKSHYPFLTKSNVIHLDSSATFPLHTRVINAVNKAMSETLGAPGKASYTSSQIVTEQTNAMRQQVADFIGADESEIFFAASATDAVKFLAAEWAVGTSILYSPEDHSRIVAEIKSKAGTIYPITYRSDGEYDYEQMKDNDASVAFVSRLHHVYGSYNYIDRIRKVLPDAKLVVDASQSISRERTNVKSNDVDALFFSSQKVGGIAGIGVLYIAKKHHTDLNLSRIEPNTIPFIPLVSMAEALKILSEQNLASTSVLLAHVTTMLIDGLQRNQNLVFSKGPAYPEYRCYGSGIISFSIKGYASHDIAMILEEHGIQVRAGDHCLDPNSADQDLVRISVHAFNEDEDIKKVIELIQKL